jgi:quinol monooxygenase YgiN
LVVLIVDVQVKPEMRDKFIELLKYDAEHSENDEPGCLRFDLLEDTEKPNHFFFYEVYKDEASMAAHRETPHFKHYFSQINDLIERPNVRNVTKSIHPTDANWR